MRNFFRKLDLSLGGIYTIMLLLVVLALFLLTYKVGHAVWAQREEVSKLKTEAGNLEKVRQEVLSLENIINEIKSNEELYAGLVPTRKQFLNNVELLEASARTTTNAQSIRITEIAPGVKKPAIKSPVPLPIKYDFANYNIELTGGFTNLVRYLRLLENEPFLMLVKKIQITAEKQISSFSTQTNTGLLKTTMEGTFFFAKD